VDSENFGHQECNFGKKLLKIRENVFSKQVLDFVLTFQIYMKYNQNLKKSKITEAYSVFFIKNSIQLN
jgi:hypothetical protein